MWARVKLDKIKPRSKDAEEAGIEMRWTNTEDRHETQVGYGVDLETEIGGES